MKVIQMPVVGLCLILFSALAAPAQVPNARTGVEEGICAFKTRNYRLAEAEFEKALQQDPRNKLLMLFTARAIDFQVDPKDRTTGGLAKARSAIEAYSKLLSEDPSDSEASSSIVRLYDQIDPARLPGIAANQATPKNVRTGILIKLAAAANTCANDITDANKTVVSKGTSRVYRFHSPKNAGELVKAKACVSDGLKLIDQALTLDTASETAWSYKTSLLIQMSRLAEMEQRAAEKADLDKQASLAKAEFRKLADAARDRQARADREEQERWEKERPTARDGEESMAKFIASGHLSRKVSIDRNSIDPRDIVLVSPTDPMPEQKVEAPPPPIVWKSVTSPDGSFSFVLPSQFDVERKFYFAKGEGMSFLLTYIDLPAGHPPTPPDTIMAGLASAVADSICGLSMLGKASSCEVRLAKKISLGTLPGLEYRVTEDSCIKVRPGLFRVYYTPTRVYALAAVGADETDPRMEKFFNSFAIKK